LNGGVPTDTAFDIFRQLFEQASTEEGPSDASLRMLLQGLDVEARNFVEWLSLPHWFDEGIAGAVLENVSHQRINKLLATVLSLPFVRTHPRGYTYHDVVRADLRRYVTQTKIEEYKNVSRRLADVFTRQYNETKDPVTQRELVYHTLGSNEPVGLSGFQTLFNTARQKRRFAICETLTRMAEEQKPALSEAGRASINFHTGLLALDQHRLPEAGALLGSVQRHLLPHSQASYVGFYRGRVSEAMGEFRIAEETYLRELRELDASGDNLELSAELCQRLAEIYLIRGELRIAEKYVQEALQANQKLGNVVGQATNLDTLGRIYGDFLDLEGARESFKMALAVLEDAGSDLHGAKLYADLAGVNLAFARFNEAEGYYKSALQIRENMEDKYGIALTNWSLGVLQLQWSGADTSEKIHHLEAAVDHLRVSLNIFNGLADRLNAGRVSASLAELFEHLGSEETALTCLKDALKEAPLEGSLHRYLTIQIERIQKELGGAGLRRRLKRLGTIVVVVLGGILFLLILVRLLVPVFFKQ
jgi:tetratricopeptide (TPR) repeat protein